MDVSQLSGVEKLCHLADLFDEHDRMKLAEVFDKTPGEIPDYLLSGRNEVQRDLRAIADELRIWQRHGVLVTQDCPTCGGSGRVRHIWASSADEDGMVWDERTEWAPCPTCSGSGKMPAEGVERFVTTWGRVKYVVPVPTDEEE